MLLVNQQQGLVTNARCDRYTTEIVVTTQQVVVISQQAAATNVGCDRYHCRSCSDLTTSCHHDTRNSSGQARIFSECEPIVWTPFHGRLDQAISFGVIAVVWTR